MARKKREDDKTPLETILELIDEAVEARGKAVLEEIEATERITKLASEARRKGATMPELTKRIKRMDKRERKLKPVTRQAIDTMIAVHEERRKPRTTRASRRRREETTAGKINTDALK